MKTTAKLLTATAALLALTACGGGGGSSSGGGSTPPASATALNYTNPTANTAHFQLVKDSSSTATNLVLNLVGPTGTTGSGVSFSFKVDSTKATWVTTPAPVANGAVFNLGSGVTLLTGKVTASGSTSELQGIASQKGMGSPVALNGVLARIQLKLVSGISPSSITFTDGGRGEVVSGGGINTFTADVGTLSAQ